MSKIDIVRAWKDEEYHLSLTEAQRASLPANPAGAIELTEIELSSVAGGITTGMCSSSSTTSCKLIQCC